LVYINLFGISIIREITLKQAYMQTSHDLHAFFLTLLVNCIHNKKI